MDCSKGVGGLVNSLSSGRWEMKLKWKMVDMYSRNPRYREVASNWPSPRRTKPSTMMFGAPADELFDVDEMLKLPRTASNDAHAVSALGDHLVDLSKANWTRLGCMLHLWFGAAAVRAFGMTLFAFPHVVSVHRSVSRVRHDGVS